MCSPTQSVTTSARPPRIRPGDGNWPLPLGTIVWTRDRIAGVQFDPGCRAILSDLMLMKVRPDAMRVRIQP